MRFCLLGYLQESGTHSRSHSNRKTHFLPEVVALLEELYSRRKSIRLDACFTIAVPLQSGKAEVGTMKFDTERLTE